MTSRSLVALTASFALTMAMAAQAQETPAPAPEAAPIGPQCTGVGLARWIGESAEGSDISAAESPLLTETTIIPDTNAVYGFKVTGESQPVRVEVASENGDPTLVLLTSDGETIEENDDFGDSLNSRVVANLGPGDYCLQVRSLDGEAMPAQVQVSREDQPALFQVEEPRAIGTCNSSTDAIALGEGPLALDAGAVSHAVPGTDISYLRFVLNEPTAMTLRAASPSLDPTVVLFDDSGNRLGENDDADGTDSRLDFPNKLAAGTYCLGVMAYSAGEGQINVSAEALDLKTYMSASYRRGELAPPADSDYPVEQIDLAEGRKVALLGGTANWSSFELDQPTVVIIEAFGKIVGVDTKLALFAPNGSVPAENDDTDESTDSRIGPILLQPGTYNLALTNISQLDQAGAPIRPVMLVFDRFVRPE